MQTLVAVALAMTLSLGNTAVAMTQSTTGTIEETQVLLASSVEVQESASHVTAEKIWQLPAELRGENYVVRTQWAAGDFTTMDQGYFTLTTEEQDDYLRVLVSGPAFKYNYNLKTGTNIFPLTAGDGTYEVKVTTHQKDSTYAVVQKWVLDVVITDHQEYSISSVLVDFNRAPNTVAKAQELMADLNTSTEKIEAVYQYVGQFAYDYDKAEREVSNPTYRPNLEQILNDQSGICYDMATIMAAMLRSQNIPCQVVTGYINDYPVYHAWVCAYDEAMGEWVYLDPTSQVDIRSMTIRQTM